MQFDSEQLIEDVKEKMRELNLPPGKACEHIRISRSTLWRILQGKTIDIEVFTKVLSFTEQDPSRYFY